MSALPSTAAPWSVTLARPGSVYLVGAGPGDPELITVRGHRLLAATDIVVYDRLVHPDLLALVPVRAKRVFVGKAAGLAMMDQAAINQLLIDHANRGLAVVRLKGGDPFVFGRGGEEAEALADAGIPFEIVPAISSSFGVPARAHIPLTHRGLAASFAVVTAHRIPGADGHDWSALARIDTLVVMMGVAALPRITETLISHGRDPATPVAIIERGTLPDERVLTTTLDRAAAVAATAQVQAPATIVVGEVVHLRQTLRTRASRSAAVSTAAADHLPAPRPIDPRPARRATLDRHPRPTPWVDTGRAASMAFSRGSHHVR
jgi:uroporphyrin-III C-methyltransferase